MVNQGSWIVLLQQGVVVVQTELELTHVGVLGDINGITTVQELDQRTIRVSNRIIIRDMHTFQLLGQTTLQVTGSRSLDGSINQTFTTSHTMEVVFLWSDTGVETLLDVTTGSGIGLVGLERSGDDLLTGPQRLRLVDGWRQSDQLGTGRMAMFWTNTTVHVLLVLLSVKEGVLVRDPNTGGNVILNQTSQWRTRSWSQVLGIGVGQVVSFRLGVFVLWEMHVHFITVEIGIVSVGVGVMQSQGLFTRQDTNPVTHHGGLMQGWLTVHDHHIVVLDVSVHLLVQNMGGVTGWSEQLVGQSLTLVQGHADQRHQGSVFVLDLDSTRPLVWTVDHSLTIVDTLTHHVLSEQTFLLFQSLLDTWWQGSGGLRVGVLGRIDVGVDVVLDGHKSVHQSVEDDLSLVDGELVLVDGGHLLVQVSDQQGGVQDVGKQLVLGVLVDLVTELGRHSEPGWWNNNGREEEHVGGDLFLGERSGVEQVVQQVGFLLEDSTHDVLGFGGE
ncbi:hypothetical protein WICPIJ_005614 [Wickerhamomyces pijperi]|uniref:Uncharacterized protein n=1 Tax=Wickerhamomyces pijperi TaxID=599730 RepID=A0A9P8Q5L2_WICPI|nr:hypothetical protein WICPIJ_005614 [Wickerhamomyces pijperi]